MEESLEENRVGIPLAVPAAGIAVTIEQKLLQRLAGKSGRPAEAVVASQDATWQR